MKDLKHLFYFENLLQEANNELVQQAKKEGKLAIRYTCFHMPGSPAQCGQLFFPQNRAPDRFLEIATYYMSQLCYKRILPCSLGRRWRERLQFFWTVLQVDACAQMNRSMENILVQKLIPGINFLCPMWMCPIR